VISWWSFHQCPCAGPSAGDHALHLRSYRSEDGLEAEIQIDEKFCSFPGVVSSGAISTLLDCHGNWTAAVTLMDEACLPRPPLTVTWNMNLTYRQPTPPNTPLLIRAKVWFRLNTVYLSASLKSVQTLVATTPCQDGRYQE
jgi:acyl-coenzyme A thioesterase PaaI-like protein